MCMMSNVGDKYSSAPMWPNWPNVIPFPAPMPVPPNGTPLINYVSRAEFDALKAIVLQMKEELIEAKKQDIADGNPDCEIEDKVSILKQIAKLFDVDLKEVFPNE